MSDARQTGPFTVALVGQPNVGKSVIMNLLTGAGAVVSNYPGTTVEITEGWLQSVKAIRVIDAPGTYSLHSDTPEQRVTQRVLLQDKVDLIVNITNARSLARSLYLTLQLIDLDIPTILVLNQLDMAEEAGIIIDVPELTDRVGLPVIPMVAAKGFGLPELKDRILDAYMTLSSGNAGKRSQYLGRSIRFSTEVESVIDFLAARIAETVPKEDGKHGHHPARALAIHLLEHDRMDEEMLKIYPELGPMIEHLQKEMASGHPPCAGCYRGCSFCPMSDGHPASLTCLERTKAAQGLTAAVQARAPRSTATGLRAHLERLLDTPITGLPILALILWVTLGGVIKFMDFAEHWVSIATSPLAAWFTAAAAGKTGLLRALLLSIPGGILLPFAVVLPAMIGIYVAMAVLEDSGLLSRVAVGMDKVMSFFGLPGQSTIPILLGFGCKAPAILGTRALPGREQRFIVSALLAITVPCAASLGIIAGLGTTFGARLSVIYGSMAVAFVALGLALGRLSKNPERHLVLEMPPLRLPVISNVVSKTWMRLQGFFGHMLPLLVITSIVIQMLLDLGLLSGLTKVSAFSLEWFGIRGEALMGVAVSIVQRYMGPMVLMNLPLSAREATIAGAMVSVSMPCLPVSILIGKEHGLGTLAKIFGIALLLSVSLGVILHLVLPAF